MSRRNSIFYALTRSYVFFAFTIILLDVFLFALWQQRVDRKLFDAAVPMIRASEVVRPDYRDIPSDTIERFEGWVEILDEQLRVVYVKGRKQDQTDQYTLPAMMNLFRDGEDNPYWVSMTPFRTVNGEAHYCLVKLPKSHLSQHFAVNNMTDRQVADFMKWSIGMLALFVLLLVLNVYGYSRWTAAKFTNPLSAIAAGIRSIGNGNYKKRLRYEANYELAVIQEHFNLMADRLEKAEQEKQRLEESKRRMLVDISHDLKTPITTIQGYAKALQLGLIRDETKKQRYLALIHDKAELVTELIEEVFELSKLESPDYKMTTEERDLAEFVRQLAADFYDQFEEKGMVFNWKIPAHEVNLSFNPGLLYRAISNLLSNAIKYNPGGTAVRLELEDAADHVELVVWDNGVGIPAELRERVFEAFVRGDASRKSDGGTGLGLTIAKKAIEWHEGELTLESSPGNTLFRVKLAKRFAGKT
ncbi:HAMP domain-containing sensor histidine kinase [Thermobacillus xylanilyticus]|uniref:HAMP domain-containing sensor histidine kinase n=1 Tax=Thermobacillus xylanilyticus TaxID=76633 RepID=UPI001BCF5627|nr:HAMP domain-containing sensor histidine kinase [Thermobacillus xylanilyticus]